MTPPSVIPILTLRRAFVSRLAGPSHPGQIRTASRRLHTLAAPPGQVRGYDAARAEGLR